MAKPEDFAWLDALESFCESFEAKGGDTVNLRARLRAGRIRQGHVDAQLMKLNELPPRLGAALLAAAAQFYADELRLGEHRRWDSSELTWLHEALVLLGLRTT